MRRSVIVNDNLDKKILNITANIMRDTNQSWPFSKTVNALLFLAIQKLSLSSDKIINAESELK